MFTKYNHHITIIVTWLFLILMLANPLPAQEEPSHLKDEDISLAIETELLTDDLVPSYSIDVSTTKGVVTLSGWVDNMLAKDRAVSLAETVKGVRSVINKIAVKPVVRTDEDLRVDVVQALVQDPATDSYAIEVKVENRVVTLTGTVHSWQEKQLTANVVKSVPGVRAIKNDVDIEYKRERSDAEIEEEIRRRFKADVWVDDELIKVEVDDGKVKLSGSTGSAAEKSRAYVNAWVMGVDAVDDSALKVKWWLRDEMRRNSRFTYKTDQEIAKAVNDAFLYDPRLNSFNPNIHVDGGVVSLTGIVNNYQAKLAAEKDAANTTGVLRVKNYLKVRPVNPPEDKQIAQEVKNAIVADPILDRYEIVVSVNNGIVYLGGLVDYPLEKSHANEVASHVNGVVEIENSIEVREIVSRKQDWEIRLDIQKELFWNPFIDSDAITVEVDGGVATLSGKVDTWRERYEAAEEAYDGGAREVRNQLQVIEEQVDINP